MDFNFDIESMKELVNLGLIWIGFGTVVGLAAKGLMPGRDPGGAIATLLMGIGGTLIGCGLLHYFCPQLDVSPMSIYGFAVGTVGAFVLLAFHKILGGYWFQEGETRRRTTSRLRSRRRRRDYAYED